LVTAKVPGKSSTPVELDAPREPAALAESDVLKELPIPVAAAVPEEASTPVEAGVSVKPSAASLLQFEQPDKICGSCGQVIP
jgi:hypothetical protein